MELDEFKDKLISEARKLNIEIENAEKFYEYMKILLEWNEKVNLTAITEEVDIIKKHFIDSLTILEYTKNKERIIDVGTGAGFPGIPVAIESNTKVTLLDSLNKRINFLNQVKETLELNNVETVHGRAEDIAQDVKYRECFDVAVSRAVASMNVLIEYLLPFVKVGGICICMKGPNAEEEIKNIEKSVKILGGEVLGIKNMKIFDNMMERNLIIIKKVSSTPKKYPRKAGTPSKEPLVL